MTTQFYAPRTINQVTVPNEVTGIDSIDWTYINNITSSSSYAISSKPLHTISGFWQEKFLSETSQLWCTNLGIPALDIVQDVVGVEFQLHVQRVARIQDLIIQLTYNGEIIGENQASLVNPVQGDIYTSDFSVPVNPIDDLHIYGAADNNWGATLTSDMVADPSFGVVISFKSNVVIPHKDLVYANQVALRVTYG